MDKKITPKNPKKPIEYICESCDFNTSNKKDYKKHLATRKHQMIISGNNDTYELPQKTHSCICGAEYKFSSGLSRHRRKCEYVKNEIIPNNENEKIKQLEKKNEIMEKAILQMAEGQQKLLEKMTTGEIPLGNTTNNTNCNNTTNNTTNNQFNLNIFLNETCKDALNIEDFVNQIKLQLSDLENQGKMGFVGGVSNILIKNLEELDVDKRPIHCTDGKRDTVYVKSNDEWKKGDEGKDQVKKAIDTITKNNTKQITEWMNKNPQSRIPQTPKSDELMKIMGNIGGGINDEEQNNNVNKVLKKVVKSSILDKNTMDN